MKQQHVSVVGYYGKSNFGDELFQDVISQNAEALFPGARARIEPRRPTGREPGRLHRLRQSVLASRSFLGSMLRMVEGLLVAVRSDTIVLGGGSVLSGLQGVRKMQLAAATVLRVRFGAIGVSVGPFADDESRDACLRFIAKMDRIVVRDRDSLRALDHLGPPRRGSLGGDLAALYDMAAFDRAARGGAGSMRVVGFAICRFAGWGDAQAADMVEALVRALSAQSKNPSDVELRIFVLDAHPEIGDRPLAEELRRRAESAGLATKIVDFRDHGVDGIVAQMAHLDAMWAVRLHAAIVSFLLDIPLVIQAYHPKCSAFAEDIELPEQVLLEHSPTLSELVAAWALLLSETPRAAMPRDEYVSRARDVYLGRR